MARPRNEHPTPAELEILRVLWADGPLTVREVKEALDADRPRAYTTVMSFLKLMVDKRLLTRRRENRAFVYSARVRREPTLRGIVGDVVDRAFDGSASALVAKLLDQTAPNADELHAIDEIIAEYRKSKRRSR